MKVTISDFTRVDRPDGEGPFMYEIPLGDIAPGSTRFISDSLIRWISANAKQQDFRVFFEARNGFWYEDLQLRVGTEDHTWHRALRVFRGHVYQKHSLLLTLIDKELPTQSPDWHK